MLKFFIVVSLECFSGQVARSIFINKLLLEDLNLDVILAVKLAVNISALVLTRLENGGFSH